MRRIVFFICVAFVVCLTSLVDAAEDAPVKGGTIEGTVTYRADAAHPWRYARYYVKNTKSGELAEAVLALRGKGLEKAPSRDALPGGESSDDKAPAPRPSPEGRGSEGEAKTVSVDQKDFQFEPELVAIRVGDSVKFTNSDTTTHNVRTACDVASFNITMPAGGAGQTIKFEKPGGIRRPVELGCVFHSHMRAWIFVFDQPFYTVTKANGKFRFENVPAGDLELEMVHPAGGLHWKKAITVKPGETVKVNVEVSPADLVRSGADINHEVTKNTKEEH